MRAFGEVLVEPLAVVVFVVLLADVDIGLAFGQMK